MNNGLIIIENEIFKLTLSSTCVVKSLVLKENNFECISSDLQVPFFSIKEQRPYHNEIKLANMTGEMVFGANSVREENGKLIVGFQMIDFEAVVDVCVKDKYIVFKLEDFIVKPTSFGLGVEPIKPPVYEFRLCQIAVEKKENFGEWLNVVWDEDIAVNVLATCPYSKIGATKTDSAIILHGDCLRDVKLKGVGVALIVSKKDKFLDVVDEFESDLGLPQGVKSRRSPFINSSYYWCNDLTPLTVDKHIKQAKKCGFKLMSVYYTSIIDEIGEFRTTGEYKKIRPEYKDGLIDLAKMLKKIKQAGITPGLHVLHSHVGLNTKYLKPIADHRLNLLERFTISAPILENDTTIYVEENPENSPTHNKMRILRFMGELIQYESFSTERPYCFKGCIRGYNGTTIRKHEVGEIGGILDMSEFFANSAYVDQRTSLQDELAEDIAKIYDKGFEFLYLDGAEGVNPPFEINVGLAQLRVYDKLKNKVLFCEGAARSHFSWHILSGGNAFDVFAPDCFKQMTVTHPFKEAPVMTKDFTRVNFGWWELKEGFRSDIIEYGTALAAAWDCPGALIGSLEGFNKLPRIDDMCEVLHRWEDARASGFITDEIKQELKKIDVEHSLIVDSNGELRLVACKMVDSAVCDEERITALVFTLDSKSCAMIWDNVGSCKVKLPIIASELKYYNSFNESELPIETVVDGAIIDVDKKKYIAYAGGIEELTQAIKKAVIIK